MAWSPLPFSRKRRCCYENKTYYKRLNFRRCIRSNLPCPAHCIIVNDTAYRSNTLSDNTADCRYSLKVPRTGSIFILAVLVGLITSMATFYPLIAAIVWGVIAELIVAGKRRNSAKALIASYCVFNLTSMGPFFAILIAKDAFLSICTTYYGAEYAATLDSLTPNWIIVVFIALALLGGLLGGLFGKRILSKHFVKAGIVA